MAEDSDLERTEEPTGRRLEKAREEGQVPHSRELGTFLVLVVSAATFWVIGGWMAQRGMAVMRKGLRLEPKFMHEPEQAFVLLSDLSVDALFACLPFLVVVLVAAVLPPLFLNAWVFAPKSLMPNFSRLDPLAGLGRIISWNGLVELAKAIVKSVLVGAVAAWVIWNNKESIAGLLAQPLESGLVSAGHLVTWAFLVVVAVIAVIVAIDVPFQLWQHHDKLKMTKEEVRQEMKEMEGDPMVKGRIRALQREAAKKRMMAAVPQANVVVTNPTHFAVALAYQSGMDAPKVVAKGMGEIAQKIKALAAEHGVPLLEAPPLARSLYRHVELDQQIPGNLYAAVAEVLAYVFQLSAWRAQGGEYPVPPKNLPVPADMMVEAA